MQKEVKRKTFSYGIGAVLLAVIFAAVCYNFGFQSNVQPASSQLKTFSSLDELENFVSTGMEQARVFGSQLYLSGSPLANVYGSYASSSERAAEHSVTNVQVAGVDEADIVKTDGEYIYTVSGSTLFILRAYPPENAAVLSKTALDETYGTEIYVNGDKLAVLETRGYPQDVSIRVYDVSDRAQPVLKRTLSLNGTLLSSRMIGNYVYAVVNQLAVGYAGNQASFEVLLPRIVTGGFAKYVQPTEIRYANITDVSYYFTTVIAVNIVQDAQEPTYESFLTGATTCMYVSLDNMYLAVPDTNIGVLLSQNEETLIYRVSLRGDRIVCEAEGSVPGYVLNQFSMDEYNGYFRIATTTGQVSRSIAQATARNNVYVLSQNLTVVGRLEDIAVGEKIYSARFVGVRCYLVTFKKVDPLFVIDVADPARPSVLGQLKVPGYSDYLHPYDEDTLIGIGKNAVEAEEGYFAWYQGIKVSLFNVSDVGHPSEMASFSVGDRGTDSPVLSDHKALLFDKEKGLLAIPVLVAEIDASKYPSGVPPYIYGDYVWQGLYVFDITESSITLRGRVTHMENQTDLLKSGYYFSSVFSVKRSLWIDNVLYTVSDKKVKMNDLESLTQINEVELS